MHAWKNITHIKTLCRTRTWTRSSRTHQTHTNTKIMLMSLSGQQHNMCSTSCDPTDATSHTNSQTRNTHQLSKSLHTYMEYSYYSSMLSNVVRMKNRSRLYPKRANSSTFDPVKRFNIVVNYFRCGCASSWTTYRPRKDYTHSSSISGRDAMGRKGRARQQRGVERGLPKATVTDEQRTDGWRTHAKRARHSHVTYLIGT